MPENEPRLFAIFLIFWIVYFVLLSSVLTLIYLRVRGTPPNNDGGGRVEGRSVSARTAWEERDRRLRKRFRRIGLALMLVPLFLPLLLALMG